MHERWGVLLNGRTIMLDGNWRRNTGRFGGDLTAVWVPDRVVFGGGVVQFGPFCQWSAKSSSNLQELLGHAARREIHHAELAQESGRFVGGADAIVPRLIMRTDLFLSAGLHTGALKTASIRRGHRR